MTTWKTAFPIARCGDGRDGLTDVLTDADVLTDVLTHVPAYARSKAAASITC